MKKYLTSESVTEGHPDKMCDQISDAILDAMLENDPLSRVACETLVTTGLVFVTGEVTTKCYVDIEKIARETIRAIGYDRPELGFSCDTCAVITSLHGQSPDIAMGVDAALEKREAGAQKTDEAETVGAGDQGMMFGYACAETEDFMPMPIHLAHRLSKQLAAVRKQGTLPYLRPDGKTQVTLEYDGDKPVRLANVVLSTQHDPYVSQDVIRRDLIEHVVKPIVPAHLLHDGSHSTQTAYFVNPTGRFVIGGPQGDCGLTGRKIIVDTYGGSANHGGGAFSGKDPTKVDRSGAYMARYIAKNIVASGIAARAEVQVAYAIGVSQPMSLSVNTYGTGRIPDGTIADIVQNHFDLRPLAIINGFGLRRPIYKQTAAYGHFGRSDLDLPWEKTDKTAIFQNV